MQALRAALLRFATDGTPVYDADGLLVIGPGPRGVQQVVAAGDYTSQAPRYPGLAIEHLPGRLLAPGFVDLHLHFPQIDVIGSPAEGLLPWLENYTFPHESRFGDAAYAQGQGVILLTPHLGCFEVVAQALALRYQADHGPLTVLFRPARKSWIAPVVAASRQRPGLSAVPTTLAGVRHMIRALRQGQAVGLLPDQVPPEGMGLWAPFFGRSAYTMTLAARLAQQTGAQVRLVWGERLPAGRGYLLHARELQAPLADALPEAVAQLNADIEGLIRECPQQYLWSYGRYKPPRAQAHESAPQAPADA
jgi:KDO2-lipid IV(A) lauroyltransferase